MTNYGILIHLYDTGMNHKGGVMVSMLTSSVVDLGSVPDRSDKRL